MTVTRVFCKEPDTVEYLMNLITPTSRYHSIKWPTGLSSHTEEAQEIVAEDIINGWKINGNKPAGTTYRYEHARF